MSNINIDKKNCIHCGACTAACNPSALYMDLQDWTLGFDELLCTNCNACVKACPLRVIKTASPI